MTCNHCGKEMIKIGELTEEESVDIGYINNKLNTSYQGRDPSVIKDIEFTEGQVFEYFRAVYSCIAEAEFLRYQFFKKLNERLNQDKELFIDYTDGSIFVHPEE